MPLHKGTYGRNGRFQLIIFYADEDEIHRAVSLLRLANLWEKGLPIQCDAAAA